MIFPTEYLDSIKPSSRASFFHIRRILEQSCQMPDQAFFPAPPARLQASFSAAASFSWSADYTAGDGYRLIYLSKGQGFLETAFGSGSLEDNSLFLFPVSKPYHLSLSEGPWQLFSLFLDGPVPDYYWQLFFACCQKPFSLSSSSTLPIRWNDFCSSFPIHQSDPVWQSEQLTALLSASVGAAQSSCKSEAGTAIPSYIIDIRDTFHRSYAKPFTLSQLENRYQISRFRIVREFTAAFGQSPMAYLNRLRLEQACQLLICTDYRIGEVSAMVGFDNTNHFINLFRRTYNMTPGAYQKQHSNIHQAGKKTT